MLKVIVVGLGVQGHKRRRVAGPECTGDVDPRNTEARYRCIEEVPPGSYDAALVCVPDATKLELLDYLVAQQKHVLVEKPLIGSDAELSRLEARARDRGVLVYTAYNHRFEPHFVRMRDTIASGELGTIYHCRLFYGNGTARLVRDSEWRDTGAGVVPDLGSHIIDTLRFWLDGWDSQMRLISADSFENRAPDHAVVSARGAHLAVDFEVTLLNWRNHFYCDILAERGSAHIRSLCKWGPSEFVLRRRVLPSGKPAEEAITLVQDDPTWESEYAWFKQAIRQGRQTDLATDRYIAGALDDLARQAADLRSR